MLKFKRRLYHGCSTVYKDGTRMLIGKEQDCVLSTDCPFWKLPKDIDSKVEMRSMLKKKNSLDQVKDSIKNDAARPDNKKQRFIKALIRIFSIMLNANLSSAKKVTKIIKQSAKLVINLWPGQKRLLLRKTNQQSLFQDHKEDRASQIGLETDN